MKIVKKKWGEEKTVVNDKYCGKIFSLNEGAVSSYHFHKKKQETFYCSDGKVLLILNNKTHILCAGDAITIFPYDEHLFYGLEQSEIIEFSTHHNDKDVFRLTKSMEKTKEIKC